MPDAASFSPLVRKLFASGRGWMHGRAGVQLPRGAPGLHGGGRPRRRGLPADRLARGQRSSQRERADARPRARRHPRARLQAQLRREVPAQRTVQLARPVPVQRRPVREPRNDQGDPLGGGRDGLRGHHARDGRPGSALARRGDQADDRTAHRRPRHQHEHQGERLRAVRASSRHLHRAALHVRAPMLHDDRLRPVRVLPSHHGAPHLARAPRDSLRERAPLLRRLGLPRAGLARRARRTGACASPSRCEATGPRTAATSLAGRSRATPTSRRSTPPTTRWPSACGRPSRTPVAASRRT